MSGNNTTNDQMMNNTDIVDLEENAVDSSTSSEVASDLSVNDSGLGSQMSTPRTLSAHSSFSHDEDVFQPPEDPNVSRPTELDSYNNPTRAEVLLLELAMHRFFTFPKDWNQTVPKLDLANSGFFLINHSKDAIQCFFCKVKISGYVSTSDVDAKHRELSPSCPLMTSAPNCCNVPIGDATSYSYEANRLYSLLTTSWTAPVDVYDLAKSGFYWTGTSDNCRCVFCSLEVRGWEPGDTADGEHGRWNVKCFFLKERSVGNVHIGQEAILANEAGSVLRLQTINNPFHRSENGSSSGNGEQISKEQLGVTPINPPRHGEYMTYAKRVDSFRLWPMCISQRPEGLAEAGFFYLGTGDRVICFQCGGGLMDWSENDSPWEEHAKWFPKCPYLFFRIGLSYSDVQRIINQPRTLPLQIAKHPEYGSDDSRLCSFTLWPHREESEEEFVHQLVRAGFFFTGLGDRVTCYSCGGGLKDLAHGRRCDPFAEHAFWFPHCKYIRLLKGDEFVDSHKSGHVKMIVADEGGIQGHTTPTEGLVYQAAVDSTATQGCNPILDLDAGGTFVTLTNQKTAVASVTGRMHHPTDESSLPTILCGICKQRRADVLYLPCAHIFSCSLCAHMESCRRCNKPSHADIPLAP